MPAAGGYSTNSNAELVDSPPSFSLLRTSAVSVALGASAFYLSDQVLR